LKQYKSTGEIIPSPRRHDNHFSGDVWDDAAFQYQVPIQNLLQESWDLIIDGTWKLSQQRKPGCVATTPMDSKMPEVDKRELLAEGNEVVENDEIVWDCKSSHRGMLYY
jgi:hypothetical protein